MSGGTGLYEAGFDSPLRARHKDGNDEVQRRGDIDDFGG